MTSSTWIGPRSEHLGREPDVGEVIELNGYRVEIVAVDDTRITKVAVAPNP